MDLYDVLGVKNTSSKKEIKNAYMRKANQNHPDKGGDVNEFVNIKKAYEVLNNDRLRLQYDTYGAFDEIIDSDIQIRGIIASSILEYISRVDVDTTDIIKECKKKYLSDVNQMNQYIININNQIINKRKALKRLKSKDGGLIERMIENDIKNQEMNIGKINMDIERANKILEMLEDYSYEVEPIQYFDNLQRANNRAGIGGYFR